MEHNFGLNIILEPKSVTTPIAMSIAERSGGIPAIAAVVVIVVGIFGSLVGPFILERLGIKNRIARGLALGPAAYGLGTAKAMELGAVEGAISGLAIGVMGIMTAILVPVIELFIGWPTSIFPAFLVTVCRLKDGELRIV